MSGGYVQSTAFSHKFCRFLPTFIFVLVLVTSANLNASSDRLDYVGERLDSAIEHEFIGGAVVGYYDSGEVQFLSKGRVNQDSETVPNETTLFEIGSITKVFTAALTQTLVDSDVLSWDSSVKTSLDDWRIVSAKIRNITLRELATHSSGLPRMPLNWRAIDPLDPYLGYDAASLQSFISDFDPPQLPKQPAYSNLGFGLLGYIAANAAGKSYSAALKDLVLDPLGMQHTQVGHSEDSRTNLASGFVQGATVPNWNFDALEGAGAVVSTAQDMVQFIKKNVEDDNSAISKSLRRLQQVQVRPNQAFAWAMQQSESGQPVFWHAGLTGGYACFLAISPEESKGWVVLTTSLSGGLVNEIGRYFFTPLPSQKQMDFSAYLGVYRMIPKMYMTIRERDNRLFAQATGQSEIPLTFVKTAEFKFDPAGMVLSFQKPKDGKSQSMRLLQRGQNINARRVEDRFGIPVRKEVEIDEETLTEYVGMYQLAPKAFLSVSLRDGQLFSTVTNQPTFPIFPLESDRFFYKQVDAEVLFKRDDDGVVSSLTLFQNGQHAASKITEADLIRMQSPPNQSNRPGAQNRPGSQNRASPPRR